MSEIKGSMDLPYFQNKKHVNLIFTNSQLTLKIFKASISSYLIISILFLIASIILFSTTTINQLLLQFHYYNKNPSENTCKLGSICTHNFTITQQYINQPLFIYYRIDDYTQKCNGYMRSFNRQQLAGMDIDQNSAQFSCRPEYSRNGQLLKTVSYGGKMLQADAIADPCGLIAANLFNDTFTLIYHVSANQSRKINVELSFINWAGYQKYIYVDSENATNTQWRTHTSASFISWMSAKGLPNTKILWGYINSGLQAGKYEIKISNNYNSSLWTGDRYVHIENTNFNVGRSKIMPSMLIIISVFCLLVAIYFYRKMKNFKEQNQ